MIFENEDEMPEEWRREKMKNESKNTRKAFTDYRSKATNLCVGFTVKFLSQG